MGSFCIYKQQKRISILCYGEFMERAILHNIRCLSFSVVYKCRRIPSCDLTSVWRYCQARLTGSISAEVRAATTLTAFSKGLNDFRRDSNSWPHEDRWSPYQLNHSNWQTYIIFFIIGSYFRKSEEKSKRLGSGWFLRFGWRCFSRQDGNCREKTTETHGKSWGHPGKM